MANIFLNRETFNASTSNSNFFGTSGNEKVIIKADTNNQIINADIEEVYFEKNLSSYTFEQSGTTIKVYENSTLISSINVNDNTSKKLAFLGTDLIDVSFQDTKLFIGDFEVPNEASGVSEGSLEKPTTTISNIEFLYDTGYDSSDLITNNMFMQTIVAKLSVSLNSGEKVYGSMDNGENWEDITSTVNGEIISWEKYIQNNTQDTIKLKVVSNSGIDGDVASAGYIKDTTNPEILDLSLSGNDLTISANEEVKNSLIKTTDGSLLTSDFSTSATFTLDLSEALIYVLNTEDKAGNNNLSDMYNYIYIGSSGSDIISTGLSSFNNYYLISGEGVDHISATYKIIDLEETSQVEDNVYIKDNNYNSSQVIKAFASGTDKINLALDLSAGNNTFNSQEVDLNNSVTFTTGIQEITGIDEKENMTDYIYVKYAMSNGDVHFQNTGDTALLSLVTTTNNTYLYKVTDTNNDGFVNNDEVALIVKLEDTNLDTGDIILDTTAPTSAFTDITYSNTNIAGGGTFTLHFSEILSSFGAVSVSDASSGSTKNAYINPSDGNLSADGLSMEFTINSSLEAGDIITLTGMTDLLGNSNTVEFTLS